MEIHNISPVFDSGSKILILGSFPSVRSREEGFFYAHKQNRFWKTVSAVFGEETPVTVPEKKRMLLEHGLSLWDVVARCDIDGSSDSSIRNVTVNDVVSLISNTKTEKIIANGNSAYSLYKKYLGDKIHVPVFRAPSTSSANASYSLERLVAEWRKLIFDR